VAAAEFLRWPQGGPMPFGYILQAVRSPWNYNAELLLFFHFYVRRSNSTMLSSLLKGRLLCVVFPVLLCCVTVLSGSLPNVDVNVKMDHKKDLVFLSSFSPTEREYRLQHYYKFMFSREPLERLVSAYRNKLLEIPTFKQRYLTKPERDRASTPEVSFTQFLAYITDLIPAKHDEHWMSASMLCQPCAVRYNFLGHHVGLPEEADWVLQHVKAPTDVRFPKRQTWYKPVSAASAVDEATRVPRAILRKALQMYAADYYLFGYNSSILHHWMV
uniref:Carbohydrate sulfotransferase n=1 Tax=Eptatretus burgeri TaxID=7764 RepID=A0A8C4NDR9_EPTBU